jgi:D-threo-aldose 1-dehydrogenase
LIDRSEGAPIRRILPKFGLGCAPIGGLFAPVGDDVAEATIEEAWRCGVRYFDTAPLYGLGLSEERLGRVLRDKPRDEFIVSTKVGRLVREGTPPEGWAEDTGRTFDFDFSYDGVMRSFEASLERLSLDRIDILLIHDPDDHHDEAIHGAFKALDALRAQGVVRAIGAGMNQVEMLTRFAREADFDCFLVAGRYTLLEQPALDALFPACEERDVAVVAGGVFNSGLLAGGSTYNYAPAPPALVERVRRLDAICGSHGVPLKAAALQFPLSHPVVRTVLCGARTPDEIRENATLFAREIAPEVWRDLLAVR